MAADNVIFGRYRLHEQIGAGGAGVVWRATHEQLHKTVALKRVSLTGLDTEQAELTRVRAFREGRLAAQISGHPHVVSVHDVLADDDAIWLVMDYLPARSLRDILKAQGRLSPAETARIGAGIADALAAAHAADIQHRDVKPANVLIGDDGSVRLTDFGISHLTGDPQLTQTGISGTPAYLAPEVAARGESSTASDIFSLGATLYAAVEGEPPFGRDDNILRLLSVVRTGIIRPPANAGPLEPLLLRLLQPTPSTRPDAATARDMLTQLAGATGSDSSGYSRWRHPLRRWWSRWCRRPARPAMITAIALSAITATVAAAVMKPWSSDAPPNEAAAAITARTPPAPTEADADPCALLDPAALRAFGRPVDLTIPPLLESCQATISTENDGTADVRVIFHRPQPVAELGERIKQVGNVETFRKGKFNIGDNPACNYFLVSPGQPTVQILTVGYEDPDRTDVCAVAEVAASTAADKLAKDDITYTPYRTVNFSLATRDACALLDDATLRNALPTIDLGRREAGYKNWSCTWGDDPAVDVGFYRYTAGADLGDPVEVAGKTAHQDDDGDSCRVLVVHQPAQFDEGADQLFTVDLADPSRSADERCALAVDLATTVEKRTANNPRDADPCRFMPAPAALKQFGDARRTVAQFLPSCGSTITGAGPETILTISFKKPRPVSGIGGTPERVGNLVIGRDSRYSRVQYNERFECSHYLWLGDDQPVIAIESRTYDAEPGHLCGVTEAATQTTLTTLNRTGGITYSPGRTAGYSHARNDACTILDSATLNAVPGLEPADPAPEYGNWTCKWTGIDDRTEVLLEFMLAEPGFRGYSDGEHKIIDNKPASISGDNESCDAYVVHRYDPTSTRATEMFHVSVTSPGTLRQRCDLATELSIAVEQQLPDA